METPLDPARSVFVAARGWEDPTRPLPAVEPPDGPPPAPPAPPPPPFATTPPTPGPGTGPRRATILVAMIVVALVAGAAGASDGFGLLGAPDGTDEPVEAHSGPTWPGAEPAASEEATEGSAEEAEDVPADGAGRSSGGSVDDDEVIELARAAADRTRSVDAARIAIDAEFDHHLLGRTELELEGHWELGTRIGTTTARQRGGDTERNVELRANGTDAWIRGSGVPGFEEAGLEDTWIGGELDEMDAIGATEDFERTFDVLGYLEGITEVVETEVAPDGGRVRWVFEIDPERAAERLDRETADRMTKAFRITGDDREMRARVEVDDDGVIRRFALEGRAGDDDAHVRGSYTFSIDDVDGPVPTPRPPQRYVDVDDLPR